MTRRVGGIESDTRGGAGSDADGGIGPVSRHRPEFLVLTAVVALFLFYYLGRADAIGTFSSPRGWLVVTGPSLSPARHFLLSGLLLGVLPVAACLLGGLGIRRLGLGLGRRRAGLALLAAGLPLAVIAGKIGAASTAMGAVYPLDPTLTADRILPYAGLQLLYYGSWEILFRGVLLFGLKDRLGEGFANVLQTALSVLAHFGRPMTETFSAIPAGLGFGWIGLRLGSIWYVALIHWLVGVSVDWFLITA